MLSHKLKILRDKTLLTQSAFAEKINVARTTYAMYEQGHRQPDYETLIRIADYHDVSTDYLLSMIDISDAQSTVTVADQGITLSIEEVKVFNELKKHPAMFQDLASDPEKKVKELIKLYKMKIKFPEEDEKQYLNEFWESED